MRIIKYILPFILICVAVDGFSQVRLKQMEKAPDSLMIVVTDSVGYQSYRYMSVLSDSISGGDNWGSQVALTDNTLSGSGITGDVLKVDTSVIATQYDLTQIDVTETDPVFNAHTVKNITNGTGLLKNNGTGTWTYDNSTYLSNAITSINSLTGAAQTIATSTTAAGFTVTSSGTTHTINLPFEGIGTGLRLGHDAKLYANSVMVGYRAGMNTGGGNNIGIGNEAVRGAVGSTGTNNIGIGIQSLLNITSAVNNVALGSYSLANLASGAHNFGLGEQALLNLISGESNVAIGRWALRSVLGSNNVGLGTFSFRTTTLSNNTGVGIQSGENNTGSGNTFIGFNSGGNSGATSSSVYIGLNAGNTIVRDNTLAIHNASSTTPLIGGHFDNMRVGINKLITDISTTLHVGGAVTIDTRTGTAATLAGFDTGGKVVTPTIGTGLSLSSGTLTATGDNWGSQVVVTDATLTGSGITGNVLKVDTSVIATQYDLTQIGGGPETDPVFSAHTTANISNGTGLLKNNGTGTWSYDNTTYGTMSNWIVSASGTAGTYTVTNGLTVGFDGANGVEAIRSTNVIQNRLTGQALALHNQSTNGFFYRNGATIGARTMAVSGNGIAISNGDGAAGNPTISLSIGTGSTQVAAGNHSHAITALTATNWRMFYSNGSGQVAEFTLGNSGQYLRSNGNAAPSWQTIAAVQGSGAASGTQYSQVTFWTASDQVAGHWNFTWDRTNSRLGINTNQPTQTLDVNGLARIRTMGAAPTKITGHDNNGVLSDVTISGLQLTGGTLQPAGTVEATWRSTTQTVSATSFTNLALGTKIIENAALTTNTTDNRFQLNGTAYNGNYRITVTFRASTGANSDLQWAIFRSGTQYQGTFGHTFTGAVVTTISGSNIIPLTGTQYLEVRALKTAGSADVSIHDLTINIERAY